MLRYLTAGVIAVSSFAVAAAQSDMDRPRWMANMARHQKIVMYGVPASYSAVRDPFPDTPAKLRRGDAIFDKNVHRAVDGAGKAPGRRDSSSFRLPLTWNGWLERQRSGPTPTSTGASPKEGKPSTPRCRCSNGPCPDGTSGPCPPISGQACRTPRHRLAPGGEMSVIRAIRRSSQLDHAGSRLLVSRVSVMSSWQGLAVKPISFSSAMALRLSQSSTE